MTPVSSQPEPAPHEEAPPGLVAGLRALHPERTAPARLDDAVLAMARTRYSARSSRRNVVLLRLAAAAAVALVGVITWQALPARRSAPLTTAAAPGGAAAPGDLNHDGVVDILDAFALARDLRDLATPLAAWDVNHDGAVDEKDIAALASAAVRLDAGAPASPAPARSVQ